MLEWLRGAHVKWWRKERHAVLASCLTSVACMGNFCVTKKKIKNQNLHFCIMILKFHFGNVIRWFHESPVPIIFCLSSHLDNWHLPPLAECVPLFVLSLWVPGTSQAPQAALACSQPLRGLVLAHLPLLKGSAVSCFPQDLLQGTSAQSQRLPTVNGR